jgi:hypothetical protein
VQDADAIEEDIGGREEREPRVLMVIIVPPDEFLEPSACMKQAREVSRVVGLVLVGGHLKPPEFEQPGGTKGRKRRGWKDIGPG